MDPCPSLLNTYLLQKTILLGSHKKQVKLSEKLVGSLYYHKCNRYIIVILCVRLKIRIKIGLNLGMLCCSELDEYPYRILHKECEFYFIIIFGTRLHSSINIH